MTPLTPLIAPTTAAPGGTGADAPTQAAPSDAATAFATLLARMGLGDAAPEPTDADPSETEMDGTADGGPDAVEAQDGDVPDHPEVLAAAHALPADAPVEHRTGSATKGAGGQPSLASPVAVAGPSALDASAPLPSNASVEAAVSAMTSGPPAAGAAVADRPALRPGDPTPADPAPRTAPSAASAPPVPSPAAPSPTAPPPAVATAVPDAPPPIAIDAGVEIRSFSAAPTAEAAPLPVRRLPDAIAAMIRDAARAAPAPVEARTEITLSPAELGRVRIVLRGDGEAIVMQVTTERAETAELVRRHADAFERAAQEAGLRLRMDLGGDGPRHGARAPDERQATATAAPDAFDPSPEPSVAAPTVPGRLDIRL